MGNLGDGESRGNILGVMETLMNHNALEAPIIFVNVLNVTISTPYDIKY